MCQCFVGECHRRARGRS
ncbi:Protein of unknown function [Propionibacterium freudenreichii subsp. freudenreichii]|uniref:Uncharacterized protein n=1 Tax=Propionibacterium freudenreichii subsp. freudenreichii TaxID=66712 RepID=A0A0B7P047_PROFF|nr:Protein of unknown function [Propionibacterium freudenreichii]CEI47926.1 Protein of unknown function [Propionibacterium freudenreichii]CEP27179.1 Protein of unknown function [Propionibacterium freudenreichii subsp. freudenreichii]